MAVLYVDDIRNPDRWWNKEKYVLIARNYNEAIKYLNNFQIDTLDLDHDLGEDKSGYDVLKFVVENDIAIDNLYLHTMNAVGRDNMRQLAERYLNCVVGIY